MTTAAAPADSMTGIPSAQITLTNTGPPKAEHSTTQPHQPYQPSTWQGEIARVAADAAINASRSLGKGDDGGRGPGGLLRATVALVLAVMANAGIVAAVVVHYVGNTAYEQEQREERRMFREELRSQRTAIYMLVDVLCENNPHACQIDRQLQRSAL